MRGPTKEKTHTSVTLATKTFAAETSPRAVFFVILTENSWSWDKYLKGLRGFKGWGRGFHYIVCAKGVTVSFKVVLYFRK